MLVSLSAIFILEGKNIVVMIKIRDSYENTEQNQGKHRISNSLTLYNLHNLKKKSPILLKGSRIQKLHNLFKRKAHTDIATQPAKKPVE